MAQFQPGEMVDFFRNQMTQQDNTPVSVVIENLSGQFGALSLEQPYIIEYDDGWYPNPKQVERFGLDPEKKYLFVFESELEAA